MIRLQDRNIYAIQLDSSTSVVMSTDSKLYLTTAVGLYDEPKE